MPSGYKYINKTKKAAKKSSWLRKVLSLLPIIVLIWAGTYGIYFFQTRNVEEKILVGNYREASNTLAPWKWLPFVSGRVDEAIGTIQLMEHNAEMASPYFDLALTKPFFRPLNIWQDITKILWANGRYHDGLYYAQHVAKKYDQQIVHFYQAGFFVGENQLEQASSELQAVGNLPEFNREIGLLKSEIEQRQTTGHYPFLIDRENLPVVNLTLKGKPIYLSDTIRPLLVNSSYNLVESFTREDSKNQTVLTIDSRIQNVAETVLDKYQGAIVLLDIKNGDILAAASHPETASVAFTQSFEPGSIIKMITLAGGLEHDLDMKKIVPYQCDGSLKLRDNKVLYCWDKHGLVKDINQATAVSCNVGFAKLGLALKPPDLIANLKQFGFNDRLSGTLPLELGKIKDSQADDEYISKLSIGLDYLNITPLHAAMIASAVANGGVCITPRLVSGHKNIIGLPFGILPSVEYRRFMSDKTAHVLTEAMKDVVNNPEGTGRRAAVATFPMAMKTGTAGKGAVGYDAVVIGFGPVPNPKVAFAVFLQHAGKAEFEGARITRLFLESIQGYI
jgi:membrane carboxypeptidase/penicillin-binding protein